MTGRLWLESIALHNVLKCLTLFSHLADGIEGAHNYLIQMSVTHEVCVLSKGVLKTGPDFLTNVFVANVETIA